MTRYICNPNDFSGNFIQEVSPKLIKVKNRKSLKRERMVELKCLNQKCNKNFITSLGNAKRIKQKYCSHKCSQEISFYFGIPNEQHPLYSRWLSMTQRCTNPNHKSYHRYGGRGISISDGLRKFIDYANYVLSLPNCPISFPTNLEIDRIDNDKGYEKGNLRWSTSSTNGANSNQPKKKHKDKYIGVNWSIRKKKYCVRLKHNNTLHYLGWFDDEYLGAKIRNEYILKNNLPNKLNKL